MIKATKENILKIYLKNVEMTENLKSILANATSRGLQYVIPTKEAFVERS